MYTWTTTGYWHKVKSGDPISPEQIELLKELGWKNDFDFTYQGAECIIQEIIETAFFL